MIAVNGSLTEVKLPYSVTFQRGIGMSLRILQGEVTERLCELPAESVH